MTGTGRIQQRDDTLERIQVFRVLEEAEARLGISAPEP